MRNSILSDRTAADIDRQVAKLLRELGNPEPPLVLEEAVDCLRLDKKFYSSSDEGVLSGLIHKAVVAGKQVAMRPSLLLDVVKKFQLRALWLPDRKRILIDSDLPAIKQRWGEAHEIGHSIIPWHESLTHGDTATSLRPACHAQIESEANFAAGRLLFLRDAFTIRMDDEELCISSLSKVSKDFSNSLTSTLWRAVEEADVQAIAFVTTHPARWDGSKTRIDECRHIIRSRTFASQFESLDEEKLLTVIAGYCRNKTGGPLGESEIVLKDAAGERHVFHFETFFNHYEALTLGVYLRPHRTSVLIAPPKAVIHHGDTIRYADGTAVRHRLPGR